MRRNRFRFILPTLFLVLSGGCAELQQIDFGRILAANAPLDQGTVASGLKEALEVGARRTTSALSAPGGFSGDPRLRLALPGQLGTLADVLRGVGFGAQVDALEASMNRAAEEAAGRAVPVFANAIRSMTIADAFEILNGPEDAATTYFRERTSAELRARFSPIVAGAMSDVGLYDIYRDLIARYERIPFAKPPAVDLETYVTDQTLTALFSELAAEEARIRKDPAARTTALLERVFGATVIDMGGA